MMKLQHNRLFKRLFKKNNLAIHAIKLAVTIGTLLCSQNIDAGLFGYFSKNFHQIDQSAFRCNQPSGKRIEKFAKKYNLKTILNLRGENPHKKWWQKEVAAAQKHNIEVVNVPLSMDALPRPVDIENILYAFNQPGNLLIHCKAGSDRTGLVSAMRKIETGHSIKTAKKEISFIPYGHVSRAHPAIRKFVITWSELREKFSPKQALAVYTKRYNANEI
jgi:protein tyrosine/serine phosphatase